MFYYPNVLQRHTGCFSTIWLAATKGIRLSRREFLRVNVGRTCNDIIDYVLVKAPPLHPGLPRPRFSLYLSSQLQYGVVIVYHRQCSILLEEIQHAIERLLRTEQQIRIDIPESDRQVLTLPDSLFLLEEAEWAQEPFFGVMGVDNVVPSPYRVPKTWPCLESASPDCPLVTGLTTSPDLITLKEKEPAVIPAAEYEGAELPEVTVKEIDMLMEQQDLFQADDKEKERDEDIRRTEKLTPHKLLIEQSKETLIEDSVWLLNEEIGQHVEDQLGGAQTEVTPPVFDLPPVPALEPERGGSTSELPVEDILLRRKRAKRHLAFVDLHVQISQEDMEAQIQNPMTETLSLFQVLTESPPLRRLSPAQLFSVPCLSQMQGDILSLWRQHAALSHSQTTGDQERREVERDADTASLDSRWKELSSREITRDLLESGLIPSEVSGASEIPLEESREERSQDLVTPVGRWSPVEDPHVGMEVIFEERVELPEQPSELEATEGSLLGFISHNLEYMEEISFDSLLPPEASRGMAASFFGKLIELVSQGKLTASQTGPYRPITISPGPRFPGI